MRRTTILAVILSIVFSAIIQAYVLCHLTRYGKDQLLLLVERFNLLPCELVNLGYARPAT